MTADADVDRTLVEELSQIVLEDVAPEELVLFEETSQEYFDDPGAVLSPERRDEALGFGIDAQLLTPYVLAVVTPVLTFLADAVLDAVRTEVRPVVADLVRRLFRRRDDSPDRPEEPVRLSGEQADRVREIAERNALTLGLAEPQARLLADSIVGGLNVSP